MIESYTFVGRTKKPIALKLNPVWWLMNDDEQTVDEAPWYLPSRPYWWRWACWNIFRNPAQNLRAYTIGVQDRDYTVTGRAPVLTVQRDDHDLPERGWQWCILHGGALWLPRPFVSYSGRRVTWYLGWQPSGFAGAKFVLHRA